MTPVEFPEPAMNPADYAVPAPSGLSADDVGKLLKGEGKAEDVAKARNAIADELFPENYRKVLGLFLGLEGETALKEQPLADKMGDDWTKSKAHSVVHLALDNVKRAIEAPEKSAAAPAQPPATP